ncbi:hypothetical protein H257_03186 [Aphanomyces astaci]|uniref:Protein kinase domain-containing protein n=1 Tax=Aphanomyces astaci TaxID=112090 RepID=W4H0C1_APHAT|nr:hypothetical protein H257_03186 [Aphanomyces astaci]ETV85450.1 hypothetical protein H257_03186 [Aphanomyces astaci]|eukprot:XP_009825468.1 hypothetical protein H257_03186 [Aphanomyces astaci]
MTAHDSPAWNTRSSQTSHRHTRKATTDTLREKQHPVASYLVIQFEMVSSFFPQCMTVFGLACCEIADSMVLIVVLPLGNMIDFSSLRLEAVVAQGATAVVQRVPREHPSILGYQYGQPCLASDGLLKLSDFGPRSDDTMTIVGSVDFVAPEMILGGNSKSAVYGTPADVYSMTIALWHILLGVPPWPSTAAARPVGPAASGVGAETLRPPPSRHYGQDGA